MIVVRSEFYIVFYDTLLTAYGFLRPLGAIFQPLRAILEASGSVLESADCIVKTNVETHLAIG